MQSDLYFFIFIAIKDNIYSYKTVFRLQYVVWENREVRVNTEQKTTSGICRRTTVVHGLFSSMGNESKRATRE